MTLYSISQESEKFELPDDRETEKEIFEIREIFKVERDKGKEIVVVQGLGFVGAMMAAVVADCEIEGKAPYFVIGVDLPSQNSFWKIRTINKGISPFKAEDPEVDEIFKKAVKVKNNLRATWVPEAYSEADIILVDINLDAIKPEIGKAEEGYADMSNFKNAIRDIGNRMRPDTLVLIETTVPPGTTEHIVKPIIEECFLERGIDLSKKSPSVAHSYERVMPGENYVRSIKEFWRTFSGTTEEATKKTREFLSDIIDTKKYPLWELPKPSASELAKILENSYRAMNIAFMYEWTLFAEDIGINLFEVIDSIRVRKGTHDNMMYPGFGVGGYCLTKDPILAEWASKNIFNRVEHLNFSINAVNVNDLMPHHTFDLLMKGMDNNIEGKKIIILGASYRQDVDDTRNSPTIALYDDIIGAGGVPEIHDPYAHEMIQRTDIIIKSDLYSALEGASAVIFVVKHKEYVELPVEILVANVNEAACIIDAFDVLTDEKISQMEKNRFKVLGVGKCHIKNI
ncbi:MAG: nucleotide sugar dehydrogenase [Methanosarcinales archaeon]